MACPKPQLTPELQQAFLSRPGELLHIHDEETHKDYLIIEQGVMPTLDEQYIRDGLALARRQIADGLTSNRCIGDVIAEAQLRHGKK